MIRLLLLAVVAGLLAYAALRWRRERREDALARARAAFFVPAEEPAFPRREPPLLEVDLADGRLRFRVPRAWDAEASPPGTFEARASSSRRLRVALRTMEGDGPPTADLLAEALRRSGPGRQGVVSVLPGGVVLLKHVRRDDGQDGPHLVYCWELQVPRPGGGPVVADFAFRVPRSALDAITEDDIRLLEREIRGATLSA